MSSYVIGVAKCASHCSNKWSAKTFAYYIIKCDSLFTNRLRPAKSFTTLHARSTLQKFLFLPFAL